MQDIFALSNFDFLLLFPTDKEREKLLSEIKTNLKIKPRSEEKINNIISEWKNNSVLDRLHLLELIIPHLDIKKGKRGILMNILNGFNKTV